MTFSTRRLTEVITEKYVLRQLATHPTVVYTGRDETLLFLVIAKGETVMYRRRNRNPLRGLTGGIVLIGIALAFAFGGGTFFLPIFFIALAFSILVGSFSTYNPRGLYGGFYGFLWMLILALFFITHSWIWFLVGAGISAILGAFAGPIMAALLGAGIFAATRNNPPYQQPYQPYQQPNQPYQQPYQPYQQGYQPPPPQPTETYQEGGQQYQYPPQQQPPYQQPEVQYPQQQELPPQQ
jgi:hypothetical protein